MIPDPPLNESEVRQAILLILIRHLRETMGWCGEEHLNKAIQFLREVTGVPIGYCINYAGYTPVAYYPETDLGSLLARDLLDCPYHSQGADFRWTEYTPNFMDFCEEVTARYEPAVRFVAERVGKWSYRELEKNSVALWVWMVKPHASRQEWIAEAMRLNTRLSQQEVIEGLDTLERMRREANAILPRDPALPVAG